MINKFISAAYQYIENGICVIAIGSEKRAFLPWKVYQERIITMSEAEFQFEHKRACALAVVCGRPSGNLEVIDVDCKYDTTGKLWEQYSGAIAATDPELFKKLLVIKTVSGGYHLYYRCKSIEGNLKLANRPTNEEEIKANPADKIRVLIETRGQGGYVLAPPSEGYTKISGEKIPQISVEERETLLELARSFNQVVEKPAQSAAGTGAYNPKDFGLSPFEDYNKRCDVRALLTSHGWTCVGENSEKTFFRRPGKDKGTSGDFLKEKNWFSVFTTSSNFEPNRAYLPYAVFTILECNGDFVAAAAKLLDMGYGQRRQYLDTKLENELWTLKYEGKTPEELEKFIEKNYKKSKDEARGIVAEKQRVWGEDILKFWDKDARGKLSINRTRFKEFLQNEGGYYLYKYDPDSTIYKIVRCLSGRVEEVSTVDIKEFITQYIETALPEHFDMGTTPGELMEIILKGNETYFSKSYLEFLPKFRHEFLKDTATEAFLTFRNGIVRITKGKIEFKNYGDFKKVVWQSQVKPFDITVEPTIDTGLVEYMQFLWKICGEDGERLEYAFTLIGYLLHKYKDPTKAFAVILAEETENEREGGGTGKGLFFKAIAEIIKVTTIDGKAFKQDKSFAFQRVGLDTNLVVLEDVKKNVDFEGFYPMITEGMTVEKKNKDELFIPYSDSPKIGFTSNYTVNATGNHGKRRQRVFEFSNFFSPSNTPEDFFGHKLFLDWDDDEKNRFYNLMFLAVQSFLENGIKVVENSEKIRRKQIRLQWGEEFFEWFSDFTDTAHPNFGRPQMLSSLYKDFVNDNGFSEKEYSLKRFKAAIVSGAEILNLRCEIRKNRQSGGGREVIVTRHGEAARESVLTLI